MSVEDAVDTLTQAGTNVLKMVHTHDGAAAVCMLIAYGSMKDRKRMIKSMKGEPSDGGNWWGRCKLIAQGSEQCFGAPAAMFAIQRSQLSLSISACHWPDGKVWDMRCCCYCCFRCW